MIIYTVGPPASGKTTWARKQVADNPDVWRRVSRQDIRDMMGVGYQFGAEMIVADVEEATLTVLVANHYSVILDNCHCTRSSIVRVQDWARYLGQQCRGQRFDTPREVCLRRNAKRPPGARVPSAIMDMMLNEYEGLDAKVVGETRSTLRGL